MDPDIPNQGLQHEPLARTVTIGIVGAGAMGAGIAQVAAVAGHAVLLFDSRNGAAQTAVESITAILEKLASKGRMTRDDVAGVRERLKIVEALSGLHGCGLVIEAIVERLDAKRELLISLETIVSSDALLATNTSSISVTSIGSALTRPERFAGMHFFNPAPIMPLVEIISGAATTAATTGALHATAAAWQKTPVYARSTPGFIVNRVARPFYGESLRVVTERGATPATLDAVLRESGGFRMGPFELMDLIGHDVNYAVTRSVFDGFYGDPRFTPSLLQLELVEAGYLGRKTGRGFYVYDGNEQPPPAAVSTSAAPASAKLHGSHPLTRVLRERLAGSGIRLEDTTSDLDKRVATLPGCVLYPTDGRTATARALTDGQPDTVLVDLALDYDKATRLALTCAEQASPSSLSEAASLLAAAGYAVSPLADVAGMVVLRTVAMLANEAADAVNQDVCTAEDCDLAMRKGVNYPLGPLEWAEELGLSFIASVLDHIAAAYGEERYRVSPLLRRKAQAGTSFLHAKENISV